MINLTENAVKQIQKFREEAGMPEGGLRVAVVGGGCSGMSYKLDFQKDPTDKDKVFEVQGVKIFVDPKSFLYVRGLTLDYSGGLNGTGFTFQNPNASKSCGCGTSFAV
jgi:iron-sulfur cluster assembly protein